MTAAAEGNTRHLLSLVALVTCLGQTPVLQWIVDTGVLGEELIAFHQSALGGAGTLVEHPAAKRAPRGFTEVRLPISELPTTVLVLLPRRLRATITDFGSGRTGR